MKFVTEYRDPDTANYLVQSINKTATTKWRIMEVCGGQTHSIMKYGLQDLLADKIELIHGPGCPVCVTDKAIIDKATLIASQSEVIFCSFGDMLRVPGSEKDLLDVRAAGGDIRVVYSPLDCLKIAQANPSKKIVFFAVGFETTAPANAMLLNQAEKLDLKNLFMLCGQVTVPPILRQLFKSKELNVQGLIAPGHVCTITGTKEYSVLSEDYQIPMVVTGFEPVDLLEGIFMLVKQLESGEFRVENQYLRSVKTSGNSEAVNMLANIFEACDRNWRGLGQVKSGGLRIRAELSRFDADQHFASRSITAAEPDYCMSGQILKGIKKPPDCPHFGRNCSPEHPLGATMVSSEGACSAYHKYAREELLK